MEETARLTADAAAVAATEEEEDFTMEESIYRPYSSTAMSMGQWANTSKVKCCAQTKRWKRICLPVGLSNRLHLKSKRKEKKKKEEKSQSQRKGGRHFWPVLTLLGVDAVLMLKMNTKTTNWQMKNGGGSAGLLQWGSDDARWRGTQERTTTKKTITVRSHSTTVALCLAVVVVVAVVVITKK